MTDSLKWLSSCVLCRTACSRCVLPSDAACRVSAGATSQRQETQGLRKQGSTAGPACECKEAADSGDRRGGRRAGKRAARERLRRQRTRAAGRGGGVQCGGEAALLGTRCLELGAQTRNLLFCVSVCAMPAERRRRRRAAARRSDRTPARWRVRASVCGRDCGRREGTWSRCACTSSPLAPLPRCSCRTPHGAAIGPAGSRSTPLRCASRARRERKACTGAARGRLQRDDTRRGAPCRVRALWRHLAVVAQCKVDEGAARHRGRRDGHRRWGG